MPEGRTSNALIRSRAIAAKAPSRSFDSPASTILSCTPSDPAARLVFITHEATEAAIQATLRDLDELDAVERITSMLRVAGS